MSKPWETGVAISDLENRSVCKNPWKVCRRRDVCLNRWPVP